MRAAVFFLLAACTVQTPEPAYAPAHPERGPEGAESKGARGCSGNDTLQVVNETVDSLNIHGNCAAVISGSRITGTLDIHGNSHVTIENTTIDGRVDLHGNAVLSTSGSTYSAGIDRHGNAYLEDGGGNSW